MDRVRDELKKARERFKMEPELLAQLIKELRLNMRQAHRAKTEMVEANLRLVISIAKSILTEDFHFLI